MLNVLFSDRAMMNKIFSYMYLLNIEAVTKQFLQIKVYSTIFIISCSVRCFPSGKDDRVRNVVKFIIYHYVRIYSLT